MSDCGCGCGGSGATTVTTTDVAAPGVGFVRPHYFGGMLLTEDDLQAAIDYTVAKRKLTNRYVIGTGVVCGLEVKQDVCDPRSIDVSPGYAIDCCGDDILVSCAAKLDVIDLVRDLRQREGVDCGEPCEEQPNDTYYLYVRYTETPTSPVAPYAPDDCATGDCEFSRVSEGYRFELRCEEETPPATLIDALRECQPDDERVKYVTGNAVRALDTFDKQQAIMQRLESHTAEPAMKAPSATTLNKVAPEGPEAKVDLDHGVELVTRVLAVQADATAPDAPRDAKRVSPPVLAKTRVVAQRLLASDELKAKPPDEQDRIKSLLNAAVEQPDLTELTPVDRAWLREGVAPGTADQTFAVQAEALKDGVLRQLYEYGESGTDEYRSVSQMRFNEISQSSGSSLTRLAGIMLRLARGCGCGAFNPPCPTCTDDAVMIAAVRVEDCEVVDVCELERHWVMSPRALGYWYPAAEALRRRLEAVCCGRKRVPLDDTGAEQAATPYEMAQAATADVALKMKVVSGDKASQQRMLELEKKLADVSRKLDAIQAVKGAPA